jgi:septum formation inhibitor-activating ATPase MinD
MSKNKVMEIEISTFEYVKTKKDGVKLTIPTEPLFLFLFHYRKAIAIVPEMTTWQLEQEGKVEELWRLRIVSVTPSDNKIEVEYIHVMKPIILEGEYNSKNSPAVEEVFRFMRGEQVNLRTRQQWVDDYEGVIEKLKEFSEGI